MAHVIVTTHDDAFHPRRGMHVLPAAHEHVVHALQAHHKNLGLEKPVVRDVFPVAERQGVEIDGDKINIIEVEPGMAFNLRAPDGYYLRLHEMHGQAGAEHIFEITVQPIADLIEEHGFDPRPTPRPQHPPK